MIPIQLQNPEFRFVRIKNRDKKPIAEEMGWRQRGGLKFNDKILLDHISKHKNYGISGGYGNLYLLDSDIPLIAEIIEKQFGETFRVQSGSGRGYHDYFIIKADKVYRTITFDKDGEHYGELRGDGNYVVCPESIHPSGGQYKIIRDLPILEIDYDSLLECLKDYTSSKKQISQDTKTSKDYGDSDIQSISLSSVFNTSRKRIANLWHGSTTGTNVVIDYSKNVWHCKRCDAGGGVAHAIGLTEGIISNCSDRLSKDQFKEVLEIARKKYGLKQQEKKIYFENQEPQGWALSINIKSMAQRYNLLNCPNCNNPFEFNERLGSYKCQGCQAFGNLKGFSKLILERRSVSQ